ncbi:putative DNA polymerase eta [Leptomonas seymouri]|uniref:Putative DNA polymerase eta n=1 Tax=Leptomonas seymouri TaxID=5684 RepID=A0A0N1PEU7_LEPSE|nr:putative DNA polymerase eta [Leptomonas seymouri]|eukprot:KPI89570.1 putative DNA polymerase eta [Leptomonas seymouri]
MSRTSPSTPPHADSVGGMRCIAHIDMDCFYAQVEAVRLGVDCRTTPFVCVQWGSFIAVNYPARALGVKRFRQTPDEAKLEFPGLRMGHIATYALGELEYGYPHVPKINTHKVSLEPYRHASRQIFAILRSEPGVIVGKAGIDEAYIDVTEAAQRELVAVRAAASGRNGSADVPLDALRDVMEPSTRLIADRRAEMQAWFGARGTSLEAVFDEPMRALLRGEGGRSVEGSRGFCVDVEDTTYASRCLLLCAASRVVYRLRQRIFAELRYDCSAGIAHNRVLAKCISATHKPNQQTLLLPDRSASALFELPLTELRGFGGKLGVAVSAVCGGAADCRDLWMVPLLQFTALQSSVFAAGDDDDAEEDGGDAQRSKRQKTIAETEPDQRKSSNDASSLSVAEYMFYRIRGVHGDKVADPAPPRFMEASKVFHPSCKSWSAARLWMPPLAGELWHRFRHHESCYYKDGRSLVVYCRTYVSPEEVRHGWRSQSYRQHTALPVVIEGAAMLAELGLRELERLMRDVTKVDIAPFKLKQRACRVPSAENLRVAPAATTTATAVATEEDRRVEDAYDSTEDDSTVPMPPLRVIGLSIIGLRPRMAGDGGAEGRGGGAAAAPVLPQRSLKEMFSDISATHGASENKVVGGAPSEERIRKRARSAAGKAVPVVEIGSDDDDDDDEGGESPAKDAQWHTGSGTCEVERRRTLAGTGSHSCASPSLPSAPAPTSASAPPRRTLAEFFHHALSAAANKAETKPAEVATLVEEERNEDGAEAIAVDRYHCLRSSTSIIEVSSGEEGDVP